MRLIGSQVSGKTVWAQGSTWFRADVGLPPGIAADVKHIHKRVNNLAPFGPTVRGEPRGSGYDPEGFRKASSRKIVDIGFKQSVHLIGKALGWNIDRVVEEREPIITSVPRKTQYIEVAAGNVAGCRHTARAYVGEREVVFLEHPQQICPEAEGVETGDYITIDGTPPVNLSIKPEIPGGVGTMAIAVNMIPDVCSARPGLLTMADLPVPRGIVGSFAAAARG